MIKVLEHGIRKVTCNKCKAKLQYEQEDIHTDTSEDSFGMKVEHFIVCPDCKSKIYISL